MLRSRLSFEAFALTLLASLVACGDNGTENSGPPQQATLAVSANLTSSSAVTVVLNVTAADIPTMLVFNIPVVNGVATGTITIPAGSNRTITMRAYDAGGVETYSGFTTVNISPGANATMSITLTPLTGDLPVTATLGFYIVTVTPVSATLHVSGQPTSQQLTASITDTQGRPIEFENSRPRFERVLPAEKAYQLVGMMENVVRRGTGTRAAIGRPVAGKTGTTNDFRDAWFVGFTPDMLTGIWVGYDSSRDLGHGDTGGHVAAPIWSAYMREALKGRPVIDFPTPSGITMASASVDTSEASEGSRTRSRHRSRPASAGSEARARQRSHREREVSPDAIDAPGRGF